MKLEIHKLGADTVVALPAELASQFGWEPGDLCEGRIEGDRLSIARTETKHDRAMRIARQGMEKYRDTMEKLAKS